MIESIRRVPNNKLWHTYLCHGEYTSRHPDCQRHTLVYQLNSGANAAPASVQALVLAVVGSWTKVAIECLILGLSRGTRMELPLTIVTLGTIRPEDNGAVFFFAKHTSLDIWACLGVISLQGPRHAQKSLSALWWKKYSLTRHALSPHPSHHHLYTFISLTDCTVWMYYKVT